MDLAQQEIDDNYKKYDIILTLYFGGELKQLVIEAYLSDEEAYKAFELFNKKIYELVNTDKGSISLSFIRRDKEGRIIRHAITGIVGIEHNIPQFTEILDDEDYNA